MDIDVTILFQLGLFLFLLVALTGVLIRPIMRVLEARYQRTVGTRAEVERLQRLAEENQSAYLARIREARNVARREREALRHVGAEERRKLLAEVRVEIAATLNQARDRVNASEEEAQKVLTAESPVLARRLAAKVIGREVAS